MRETVGMTRTTAWRKIAIAAAAVGAIGAAVVLPRPTLHVSTAPMAVGPTVPAQLTAEQSMPAGGTQSTAVVVYVCGAVKKPGVYSMPAGSRVVDALAKAGGALPDAQVDELNLSTPLTDAMKVAVPEKQDRLAPAGLDGGGEPIGAPTIGGARPDAGRSAAHRRGRGSARAARGSSSRKLAPGQTLDINTAGPDQLAGLPGVGPSLAERIVDYRAQNGPFQTVDDLQNVSGIGPAKFEKMQGYIRL